MMTHWGVRFAALLGSGTYEISKALEIKIRHSSAAMTNALKWSDVSWFVQCVQPVALCISHRAVSEMRLRERLPNNKGQIFHGTPTTTLSKGNVAAQLFTVRIAGSVTNTLEAEVVVRWPAVEFFVQKPQ